MSHNTFKDQSTRARVRAITYVCIDGLPSNLIQMLSLLRRCAYIQEYLSLIKQLVFPIFPFLTSGSVQWSGSMYPSGSEKNKMV